MNRFDAGAEEKDFRLTALCILLFAMFFLDNPISWYALNPPTKILGDLLLFSKLLPPFHNFEVCMFVLAVAFFASPHHSPQKAPDYGVLRIGLAITIFYPLAFLIAAFIGIKAGADNSFLRIQLRGPIFFPLSLFLGYLCVQKAADLFRILDTILWALVSKSISAIVFFVVGMGASMGEMEHLIDHATSDFFLFAMIYSLLKPYFTPRTSFDTLRSILPCLIILVPYILNDRRTAILAMIVSVAMTVFLMNKQFIKRYWFRVIAPLAAIVLVVLASGVLPAPLNSLYLKVEKNWAQDLDTLGYLDYRVVENYNLLAAISRTGVLGIGLGIAIPFVFLEYDFRYAYPYYDTLVHNSFLGTWVSAGVLGMAALATAVVGLVWVFSKTFLEATDPAARFFSILGFLALTRWGVWTIGDVGTTYTFIILYIGLLAGGVLRLYGRSELQT